jgi:hypothetical protein
MATNNAINVGLSGSTGSVNFVGSTSPTLVTPVLGVASVTTINKVTITTPATGSTLTIADGKTLTVNNILTFTGVDSSSVAFGAGGTVAYVGQTQNWNSIAGTSQTAVVDQNYVVANAGQTTITLPVTAALGSTVGVQGLGAAGWILAAGVGQTIKFGSSTTSSGGSLTSSNLYDSITVVCIVANTTWAVFGAPQTSGLTVA